MDAQAQSHSTVSVPSSAELLLSTSSTGVCPFSPHDHPGSTSHELTRKNLRAQDESSRRATTICMLSDNVLLEIFDFYRRNRETRGIVVWDLEWHLLVHVCRRWRQIVFGSPHRLDLRILCRRGSPVRQNLSIWPAFPIVVDCSYRYHTTPGNEDDIIAALKHRDRVCDLRLDVTSSQLRKMTTVLLEEPFPVLTRLHISSDGTARNLPGRFLGRSAPSLQALHLHRIPFPKLPTLLLSTGDLVTLELSHIPQSGYISPEAMVVGLAALPKLKHFTMESQSVAFYPDRINPPPTTRTVLPALIQFEFQGTGEYLEAFVAQIDSPQLDRLNIDYFNHWQLANFRAAQLSQFIDRSAGPEITLVRHAKVIFFSDLVSFTMSPHADYPYLHRRRAIIRCKWINWQVSHMAQVLSQCPMALSNVVHLQLEQHLDSKEMALGDVEWLRLLHRFPSVRTFQVNRELAGQVALALEDITEEMATEVLPSLALICLEGQCVKKFAARRLSSRPVIVCTKKEFDERLESYVGE